jgi:FKBP-type peptidyl-prolyl cis-trans isomerase SlyD
MKVENNTVVSVTYTLFAGKANEEKSFIETADNENPLTFLYGVGGLIETFENNLKDLSKGDKFDFDIPAEKAYGTVDEEAVVNLPRDIFMQDGVVEKDLLTLGNVIPMTDDQGNRLNGKVVKLNDSEVTMDFNHPLAGHDLHFQGEVIEVRKATDEEIAHGHVHHDGHHHH